jgi:hypothetical protein
VSEEAERIVYEESVRTLSQQKEVLDGLRARAGTLLGAVSIATAFLSSQALDTTELGSLEWIVIVLFCLVVLLSLAVLVPFPWSWKFAHHPHLLIGIHLESERPPPRWKPSSPSEIYRNISYWNGVHYDKNGRKLALMFFLFTAACLALAAEIVIWLILLAR